MDGPDQEGRPLRPTARRGQARVPRFPIHGRTNPGKLYAGEFANSLTLEGRARFKLALAFSVKAALARRDDG